MNDRRSGEIVRETEDGGGASNNRVGDKIIYGLVGEETRQVEKYCRDGA